MQAGNGCGTNSAAQGLRICHCEGASRLWQSREGSHDFVGTCLLSTRVLRDFHIASLPGMTNLGVSRHKIHTSNIASLQGGHSPQGHAASVRPQSRQRLRSERPTDAIGLYVLSAAGTNRQCLPEIATGEKRPRNDNLGGIYHFNDSLYGRQVRRRARHASPLLFHTYRSGGQMSSSAEKTGRFSGKKFQKALAFRVFQCYNKDNL